MFLWKLGEKILSQGSPETCSRTWKRISIFRLSHLCLKLVCFSVLWSVPLAQVRWSQVAKAEMTLGMPWQAVGRAAVWLQELASHSQAVMITTFSLCLLPLLSPIDKGYDQHEKSLIIWFTCSEQWGESYNKPINTEVQLICLVSFLFFFNLL